MDADKVMHQLYSNTETYYLVIAGEYWFSRFV